MRRAVLLAATLLAFASPPPLLFAQTTPAEQASRRLNEAIGQDRRRDAADAARDADTARAAPTPTVNDAARQLEADRATIRPDVGRPEQSGAAPGTLRSTGEDRNITR